MFLLSVTAYTVGVQYESDDAFCASCHVEPESAYYRESLREPPPTLAAFHAELQTRCIDCHSRAWIPGRLWAQWGGLQNLLAFRSGDYRDPAETTRPAGEGGCTKCHRNLTWVSERPGHYHSPWLSRRWQQSGGPANACQACHPSHQSVVSLDQNFMEQVEEQCQACHETASIDR